jgi:parvulin-like peptidyl-prolyl isomerase
MTKTLRVSGLLVLAGTVLAAATAGFKLLELVRRCWSFYGGLERGLPLPIEPARAAAAGIESRLGKATYAAGLTQRGWTREDHVRSLAETLLGQQAYRCFVAEPARVTTSEVRAAFEAAPGRWRVPESRHVLQILLAVAPDAPAETAGAREKEAREIARQARTDPTGAEFAALAARVSEGPYRVKGGDLGWAHRGRLVEPLEAAVWNAPLGEVVGPLRGDDGWHLVKVVGERPARLQSFEEVLPVLRTELEAGRLQERERAWFGDLAAGYPVLVWEHGLGLKGAP